MKDMHELVNIQGKTAVITGADGELGRPMAYALSQAGVQVAILSLHADLRIKQPRRSWANGGQALGIACDVRDHEALEHALQQVTAAFSPVDILINAAAATSQAR